MCPVLLSCLYSALPAAINTSAHEREQKAREDIQGISGSWRLFRQKG